MADRFFTPQLLGLGDVALDGDEAKHMTTVRRFAPGDRVVLFNGDGNEYPASILEAGKRLVSLRIESVETPNRERPFPLIVAAAIPKADRFDFLIEKLVETTLDFMTIPCFGETRVILCTLSCSMRRN